MVPVSADFTVLGHAASARDSVLVPNDAHPPTPVDREPLSELNNSAADPQPPHSIDSSTPPLPFYHNDPSVTNNCSTSNNINSSHLASSSPAPQHVCNGESSNIPTSQSRPDQIAGRDPPETAKPADPSASPSDPAVAQPLPLDSEHIGTARSDVVGPTSSRRPPRVYFRFPDALERALAPFDDPFIAPAQRLWSIVAVRSFILSVTVFTAIEAALPVPGALYALGYDASAGLMTSMLIVLAFGSQVPKKFIFRARPWMSRRAFPFRQDMTSSFPSRAVACAVVFTWLAFVCTCYELGSMTSGASARAFQPLLWTLLSASAVIAALARVSAGAHYPSDTICGFFLGLAVILLGLRFERFWSRFGCATLRGVPGVSRWVLRLTAPDVDTAFMSPASSVLVSFRALLRQTPYSRLSTAIVLSYVLTVVSIQGFWVKCNYVYGMLFSSATFRAVYLCPARTGIVVESLQPRGGFRQLFTAVVYFASWLGLGMATKGVKGMMRIALFTFIYFGVFLSIVLWRLKPWTA